MLFFLGFDELFTIMFIISIYFHHHNLNRLFNPEFYVLFKKHLENKVPYDRIFTHLNVSTQNDSEKTKKIFKHWLEMFFFPYS